MWTETGGRQEAGSAKGLEKVSQAKGAADAGRSPVCAYDREEA